MKCTSVTALKKDYYVITIIKDFIYELVNVYLIHASTAKLQIYMNIVMLACKAVSKEDLLKNLADLLFTSQRLGAWFILR